MKLARLRALTHAGVGLGVAGVGLGRNEVSPFKGIDTVLHLQIPFSIVGRNEVSPFKGIDTLLPFQ